MKFIKGTIVSIWVVVAIITTICLLAYNDYMVSDFGDYSLFVVDNKSLEPKFKKHDLVIVKKGEENDYNIGDYLFFYMGNKETMSYINLGQVIDIDRIDRAEDVFKFDSIDRSYGHIMGKADGAIVWRKVGLILGVLKSRWGFMFLIILPTLYAVVYEVYSIVLEVKKESKKELSGEEKKS